MNARPINAIRPVQRALKKKPEIIADPITPEPPTTAPVVTSLSELGVHRAKDRAEEAKDYQPRNPLWNTMLNI